MWNTSLLTKPKVLDWRAGREGLAEGSWLAGGLEGTDMAKLQARVRSLPRLATLLRPLEPVNLPSAFQDILFKIVRYWGRCCIILNLILERGN